MATPPKDGLWHTLRPDTTAGALIGAYGYAAQLPGWTPFGRGNDARFAKGASGQVSPYNHEKGTPATKLTLQPSSR
jgi:hypothetical protein